MSSLANSNESGSRDPEADNGTEDLQRQTKDTFVERVNLKDQLARALRLAILTGRMRPGTTYTMGVLADQYGASRTPIREAVLELEAKGLVEITRGVGFSVCELSPKEWADAVAVREMLEVPTMKSLAGRLSAGDLAKARLILERIERAALANDIVEYLECDEEFHLFLIALADNPKLTQIVSMLRDTQRVPGLAHIADEGHLGTRHFEHVKILEAIEAGDSELVVDLVRSHIALSKMPTSHEEDVRLKSESSPDPRN